ARWNMNLSDWCAQLALPQLQSHAENLQQRRQIAGRYTEAFADLREKLEVPEPCPGHVWYRYVLLTPEASEAWIEELVSQGIETKRPVYAPLQRTFGLSGRFPVAEDHWRRSLSLPIYPTLTEGEQEQVIEAVKRAAGRLL
ncbi:MAG: DegT/DnrJ/EryC1/StrS family aminotransferase, partial [Candidatus Omnitrophica bacterium]|nr:DegT/DnrJ/EryC1/StrS family aminotransferase [Candidatus Omnitrophota bacterium]